MKPGSGAMYSKQIRALESQNEKLKEYAAKVEEQNKKLDAQIAQQGQLIKHMQEKDTFNLRMTAVDLAVKAGAQFGNFDRIADSIIRYVLPDQEHNLEKAEESESRKNNRKVYPEPV